MRCTRCGKEDPHTEHNHGLCTLCNSQVEALTKKQAEIYAKTLQENSPEEREKREAFQRSFIIGIFVVIIWLISLPFRLIGWIIKKDKEQKEKETTEYERQNPTEIHKLYKSVKDAFEYWNAKPDYEIPYTGHNCTGSYAEFVTGLFMGGICFVACWRFLHIRYNIPEETTLVYGILLGGLWYICFIYVLVANSLRHKKFVNWVLNSASAKKAVAFIESYTPENNNFDDKDETQKNIWRLREHRRAFPKENNQVSLVKYIYEQREQLKLFEFVSAAQYVNFSLQVRWLIVLFVLPAIDLFWGGIAAVVCFILWVCFKRNQYFRYLRKYNKELEEKLQKETATSINTGAVDSENTTQFTCNCPHCNGRFEVEKDWDGMETECPTCNQKFIIKVN